MSTRYSFFASSWGNLQRPLAFNDPLFGSWLSKPVYDSDNLKLADIRASHSVIVDVNISYLNAAACCSHHLQLVSGYGRCCGLINIGTNAVPYIVDGGMRMMSMRFSHAVL